MDSEENRREERLRRETGQPTSDEGYRAEDDPAPSVRRRGSEDARRGTIGPDIAEGAGQGTAGQRISRDEIRRAARDGIVDREEELKGDGLYGSSTSSGLHIR